IGDLVDPHTAVALAVADRDTSDSRTPNIVLSTAHSSKFPDAVEAACGVRPELPAWLEGLMSKPEHIKIMKNDQVEVERFVLSVILANPSFVPDELEREKSVIVQEIGAAQDTPDDVVFEHLNELCYPDQPMGRSLLGTAKTLKGFDRDTLRRYLSTHYRGPDMVVTAAGAVDHKRVVEEVAQRFASFDGSPAPKPQAAMF